MSRRQLPKPTQREGSLTWEIRARIGGKIRTRTLRTRDYDVALKRVPGVFSQLLTQYEDQDTDSVPPAVLIDTVSAAPRYLSIDEVCQSYRLKYLDGERQHRKEVAGGGIFDPIKTAANYRRGIEIALANARAQAISHDFANEEWYLTYLSRKGLGEVENRDAALLALARTRVETYQEMMRDDLFLLSEAKECAERNLLTAAPRTPLLSSVLEQYIRERGAALTSQVAGEHRAVVRDLISVVGDKPIDCFGKEDARALKDILLDLPANWKKRRELRELSLREAAEKAKSLAIPRQAAKTIHMKRAMLRAVFDYAAENYDDIKNPFAGAAWVVADQAASDQRDAFSNAELTILMSSKLPGHLYWLTWLGLCTGARLNELCQLTTKHVTDQDSVARIYFSPELRLKTRRSRSNASIRSVPLHKKLIELKFLEYVKNCENNLDGLLFPGIPKHSSGRFSDAPSKAFRRHLVELGIKHKGLSYHSLRHTFSAEFKRTVPSEFETRERLMGHAVSGVAGRYGNSYEAEANDHGLLNVRAQIVNKLNFEF